MKTKKIRAFAYNGSPLPFALRATGDTAGTLTITAAGSTPTKKRFTGLAYSGGPLTLKDYPVPVVVDLQGVTVEAQSLQMFKDHDPTNHIATSDAITVHATKGITVSGEIDSAKPDGELIVAAGKGGLAWELSIGAPVQAMERVDQGEKVTVNGRTFTGPLLVARKTTLKEISFVRRGADVNQTHVAIAAKLGGKPMFEEWIKAQGFDVATLSDTQKTALQKAYDAEQAAKTPPPVQATAPPAVTHTNDLKAFAKQLRDSFQIEALLKDHDDIRAQACGTDGELKPDWSKGRIEDAIALKEIRASRPVFAGIAPAGGNDREATLQAIQGAMILKAGGKLDHPSYLTASAVAMRLPGWIRAGINTDQRQRAMEMAHKFANFSAVDICRLACTLDGKAPSHDREEMIRAAFSGSSLTNIFTTSVNATLIAAYMEAGDTTAAWTQKTDVNDFKTNDDIQLVKDGTGMKKLPLGTEAQHGKRSDKIESYRIARYAEQMVLDEQDIIDDNLGAFSEIPTEMGYKAARLCPDLVYAILLANPTLGATALALFSDSNSPDNLRASSALTAANLKLAIPQMQNGQENGVNLNIAPTHLLVPPSLQFTAKELMNSSLIVSGDTAMRGNKNVLEGALEIVSDARLENGVVDPNSGTTYSGSATTWFLASTMARTIRVAYLAGTGRAPKVRNFTLSEGKWGMGWDINMDIGAAAMDFRGLQKNTA